MLVMGFFYVFLSSCLLFPCSLSCIDTSIISFLCFYANILSTNVATRLSDKYSSSRVMVVSWLVASVIFLKPGLVLSTSGWHKALQFNALGPQPLLLIA
jgi:hypothetical protein